MSARPAGPSLSRRLIGRLGAALFALGAAVVLVSLPLPQPPGANRLGAAATGVVSITIGIVAWFAPWDAWAPSSTLWLVPVALAVVAGGNVFGGVEPFTYGVFFPLMFTWIGLGHPRWTSTRFAIPAAVAYVVPLALERRPASEMSTVTVLIGVSVLIGESAGWVADRLRTAEQHVRVREARLRLFLDQVPAIIWTTDRDLRFTSGAGAGVETFGMRLFDPGETVTGYMQGADSTRTVTEAHRRALSGESTSYEISFQGREYQSWVEPLRSEEGDITGCLGLTMDVTDRKEAERSLRAAYEREREAVERLRSLDQLKDAFLQAVSHELRTPLTSVLGNALTLERIGAGGDEELRAQLLSRLAVNARKLERLLGDLLDLDRLSRGMVEPNRRPTELSALAAAVLRDIDLSRHDVRLDAEPIVADVDAPKVERIIENLVTNAVRYTPDGTHVTVRITSRDGGVLVVVDQDAAGIPDDLKDAVFEPFRQGPGVAQHSPGTGVGLTLVARFAELHGGRAWVEDRDDGGASFLVFLPAGVSTGTGAR